MKLKPIRITIIVAVNKNDVIGDNGSIPWHEPADLKHFAETVKNKVVICGRETLQSLPSKYETQRTIVLTRRPSRISHYKVQYARTLFAGLTKARNIINDLKLSNEIFIIGGGMVYEAAMPLAHKMIISRINNYAQGDTKFPDFDKNEWEMEAMTSYSNFEVFYLTRK